MQEIPSNKGSMETVPPIEFSQDTVWVRKNVIQLKAPTEEDKSALWQYDETQYSYEEYVQLLHEQNRLLKSQLLELEEVTFNQAYELALLKTEVEPMNL